MVTCGVVPAVFQPVLAGVCSKPGLINWFRPPIPGPTPPVTVSQIVLPFNDRFPVTPGGRLSAGAVVETGIKKAVEKFRTTRKFTDVTLKYARDSRTTGFGEIGAKMISPSSRK